ncbi:MAG: S-methyl-5'-thioadenosine phosphorylase [Spirochaetales bacterium]|nr:S-methyl-5'-thioadenosine phosphorylase [Spirochaetales bacterium]
MKARFGIIGGSGLEEFEGGKVVERLEVPTPFGMPSDEILLVDVGGIPAAFLPRHGHGHRILPTEVNSKANIWALKSLGVEAILAVSAVGSLREDYKPGEFVICDNLIDRTKRRDVSYFGNGVVGHIGFADPFCPELRAALASSLKKTGHPFHDKGTAVTMEGAAFSTRAESEVHRGLGAHVIGMTASPEAKLAREAEICYASVAMVTDYDCWRQSEEAVTLEMVLETMRTNVDAVRKLIPVAVPLFAGIKDCSCRHAAEGALMTSEKYVPYEEKRKLKLFFGKYWKG